MKKHPSFGTACYALAVFLTTFAAFDVPALASTSDPSKSHALFMGADFAVELDGKVCPVKGVFGSYWIVEEEGTEVKIGTRNRSLPLKVTPRLKLTESTATLEGYSPMVGYSPKNDPSTRLTRALDDAAAANIGRQTAVTQGEIFQMHWTSITQSVDRAFQAANGGLQPASDPSSLYGGPLAAANAGDVSDGEPTGEIHSRGKDAVDVSFVVTTSREIDDAYIVTVARFRGRGDKPGVYRKLIYAQSIGTIDASRRTISANVSGFPPGFELLDFQLHLYHSGLEMATNISSKRVDLTRDEAFEYVKTEYVGSNKGVTLPAVPAMGHLPADFPSQLATGRYGETLYVKVGSDGIPSDVFSDPDCSRRIEDPYVERVVKGLLFKPALQRGSPVDSVAAIRLDQLKI